MDSLNEIGAKLSGAVMEIPSWSLANQVLLLLGFILIYVVLLGVYRLYFDPLSAFPGPKLAAFTVWYACYYDVIGGGQYIWVIEKMHKKYGPIVRIRPDVLHMNDPQFIDQIYTGGGQKREKYKTTTNPIMAEGSILTTHDHDLHKRRRAALNPYFSKQNVRRVEPVINSTLATLLRRMDQWAQTGEPAPIARAYQAAIKDIIHSYSFGEGEKYLEMDDMNKEFLGLMDSQTTAQIGAYFPWINKLMAAVPPKILFKLYPALIRYMSFLNGINAQIEDARKAKDRPEGKTIFHEILNSDMPESEKATHRISDEAVVLVMAGTMSTAATLQAITYHLLTEPRILKRLKAELESVMPDPNELPNGSKLDSLPYLNAIISEATRLHPGVSIHQDRIAPDQDLMYTAPGGKTYRIPAGTPVGMSAPLINRHASLYEDPTVFRPERWLENPKLSKYQLTFSRGSRQCIGINLALQELQTITAGIFRKYSLYDGTGTQKEPTLELYETTRADIELHADFVTSSARPGSVGVRLLIRR